MLNHLLADDSHEILSLFQMEMKRVVCHGHDWVKYLIDTLKLSCCPKLGKNFFLYNGRQNYCIKLGKTVFTPSKFATFHFRFPFLWNSPQCFITACCRRERKVFLQAVSSLWEEISIQCPPNYAYACSYRRQTICMPALWEKIYTERQFEGTFNHTSQRENEL